VGSVCITLIVVVKNLNFFKFLQRFCRLFYNKISKDQLNMNNLENTLPTSRASDQAQNGSSDTTVFNHSQLHRIGIENGHSQSSSSLSATNSVNLEAEVDSEAETENVPLLTEPTASQSQRLPNSSFNYKASGLKDTLHGDIYQLKLLMLILNRGLHKGYSFRFATEMDDAEKFDDIVFRYTDQGKDVIRFLQAKHKQDQAKKISKNDLLKEPEAKPSDFSLQKYFISYRKITKNPAFSGAELKDFILFTNIDLAAEIRDGFELILETDPILSMTWNSPQNRTAKLLRIKIPFLQVEIQALMHTLCNTSDLRRLANKISDCALEKAKSPLNLRSPLLQMYHQALAQNVIDIKKKKFKSSFFNCEASLSQKVKKFRSFLNKENLPEDDFRKKLAECDFTIQGGFGKLTNKEQTYLLPDDEIRPEEVEQFLKKLVFAVNQPNEIELWDIIKSEIREFHNIKLNDMDLMASEFQTKMLDWLKRKEGHFLNYENGQTLFNGTKQKMAGLMCAGITKYRRSKLDDFGIAFVDDDVDLSAFLIKTNKKQIFNLIVQGRVILGSLMVHQTMKNCEEIDCLNDDGCIFVSLRCLLDLRTLINEAFQRTQLLVIEFEDLNEAESEIVYEGLCDTLEAHSDKKCVLVTQEFSSSTKYFPFKSDRKLKERYEEKTVKLNFKDLTMMSKDKLLLQSKISFQGEQLTLADLVSHDENVIAAIDGEMLHKMMTNEQDDIIHLGKPLIGLEEVKKYYIPRVLMRAVRIKYGFETDKLEFVVRDTSVISITQYNKIRLLNEDIVLISDSLLFFNQLKAGYSQENIHWLKKDSNGLKWQRTHGDVSGLRESLMTTDHHEIIIHKITQIPDKVVIISSEPGMGKSTLLTELANNTKRLFPTKWILRINLNDCTDDLYAEDFNPAHFEAVDFLLRIAKITSQFEIELFKNSLRKISSIVLLFDGFDEISPDYKDKVLQLILALRKTKIQKIWIASRPHLRNELEEKFRTFAYTIKPLTMDNQESLIEGLWKHKIGLSKKTINTPRLKEFAKEILILFSKSVADSNKVTQFAGIPLQTMMLAEYFYDEVNANVSFSLPLRLNILDLYKRFIEKKYKIHGGEKKRQDWTNVAVRSDDVLLFENFLNRHEVLALNTLFGEEFVKCFLPKKDQIRATLIDEVAEGKERTGIIVETINQRQMFTHRAFADYFAATWLAKNIQNSKIKNFLRKVLFQDGNEILRNFFDRILCDESCELHNEVLNGDRTKVNDLIVAHHQAVDKGGRTSLHLASSFGDKDIVNTLLNNNADARARDELFNWCPAIYADMCIKLDVALLLLRKMVTDYETYEFIDKYEGLINDPNGTHFFGDFLHSPGSLVVIPKKNTLLHIAVEEKDMRFSECLLLNGFCLDAVNADGRTVLHLAVRNDSESVVKILIEFNSNSLFVLEASDLERYRKLREFINMKDNEGNNALCLASKLTCSDVCEYLVEIYLETIDNLPANSDELESFFNCKNNDGDTPFSLASANGSERCIRLWMRQFVNCNSEVKAVSAKEYCNQMHGFLSSKNKMGLTPLHLAVQYYKYGVTLNIVRCLEGFYANTLTSVNPVDRSVNRKTLLAFLNVADNHGNTPLCLASKNGDEDICKYLIQRNLLILFPLKGKNITLYRDGLRNFFYYTNLNGDTPLALACAEGRQNCTELWTRTYVDYISYFEMTKDENKRQVLERYFQTENKNGMTPLNLAKSTGKYFAIKDFLKLIVMNEPTSPQTR
jgi:ankyrin repeat protein